MTQLGLFGMHWWTPHLPAKRWRTVRSMELQEVVLEPWMLVCEWVCGSAVCDTVLEGKEQPWFPPWAYRCWCLLLERAHSLCYFVCKMLFLPRWKFFHCYFPLIKWVFSPFVACIHSIFVPKLVRSLIHFLPKVHYLGVKITLRNLVASNSSSLKFKQ